MRYVLQAVVVVLLQFVFIQSNGTTSDIDVIKKRVFEQAVQPLPDNIVIENLIASIKADGTWPGIDYEDVSREGFQHARHSSNMVILARAYKSKESKYYKKKEVKAAIEKALKNWVDHDYFCENWWHNQIGTPNNLVTLMLLVGDDLPKDLVEKAQPIIGRAHLTASGARPSGDRIKIAGILAKNLLFIGDKEQFDQVIKVIESEIKFNTGQRGMQHDFSFHHRQDRVNNTLSYGLGYADAFAEWAAYVAGTEYAFSEEKIDQLVDYFLDGICKQMVYGRTDDPGTKNRDVSRRESGRPAGTATPERLLKSADYRKLELEEIIKIRKGEAAASLSFGKFFWQTEHYSHQRPEYFTSVRMFSTRNRNTEEPYNSEGLKNHHKADGANYISVTGEEYTNIAPVFDWQKIPGTTVMQKPELPAPNEIQKDGLTDFVGAVTDGMYGAVGFDFKSPHGPLSAKKAWFFFDKEYVCLGTAIKAQSNLPVATTLNQCLLHGDVAVGSNNQKSILEKGDHQLVNVDWIFHDGIGYLFPQPVKVNVSNQAQTGSWYSINKQVDSPKEEVSLDVFNLWLDHGSRPANESYEYIVVPAVTEQELVGSDGREIEILSNSDEIQAMKHSGLQVCQAVFYKAGELQISDKVKIISDHPGIVMIKLDGDKVISVSVADPARNLGRYHLAISGKTAEQGDNFIASWNEKSGLTRIAVDLPQGVYCGKSVSIKL
ncbi:polysaccharide lyase family 8 super-sandwich domain-containing protein [Maribellus sp. YY47]|uniref:polysaccharide lyase family 8 super-sandwich domain-containing protein n=1 Tax=Maribellus sp. YY47 TaxID=2929486 RepID=UPI00200131B6|nr:polysaccharide lyase family 8 super-sandwich domain-containing protein [Maribellus sp. YY47]MCK3685346.1 polysaccharide lyase beta-sandwich domain-containing protein [Maribellus sp. YY47]